MKRLEKDGAETITNEQKGMAVILVIILLVLLLGAGLYYFRSSIGLDKIDEYLNLNKYTVVRNTTYGYK